MERAPRIFLLSPASCRGRRAGWLIDPAARSELAARLRSAEGAALGDVFAFISALYFRGKLGYARTFARAPEGRAGALVITPGRGLLSVDEPVRRRDLVAFAEVEVHEDNDAYRAPLERDLAAVGRWLGPDGEAVLLGSVATSKYVAVLRATLGERLLFPTSFAGRGDMSRGGLLLRAACAGEELAYRPVGEGTHHGPRPPRLPRSR